MEPKSLWQLSGTTAHLQNASLRLSVDVSSPSSGISDIHVDGDALSDCRLHCVDIPPSSRTESLAEHYVRGNDLVAAYQQTPDRNVRAQIYWRGLESVPAGIELLVSIQTSLLESHPTISMGSTFCQGELYRFDGSGFPLTAESIESDSHLVVFRPHEKAFSYVEIIHPSDCQTLRITVDGQTATTRFSLFQHDLEKGVIRRGRMRSFFIPRKNDFDAATELLREFECSPAPLTT
ncbi:hypothetical protein ACFL2H_11970 [Planctomycetota bacterium]